MTKRLDPSRFCLGKRILTQIKRRQRPLGGVIIAISINNSTNEKMASLNVSDNQLCGHWKTPDFSGFKALISAIEQHELLTVEAVDMGESLDVSGQNIGLDGAKLMATFIKNNGALENLHIGNNNIPTNEMHEIITIVEAKPEMKVFCAVPFRDTTIPELDVSGQSLGVEGALVIRRYLENNGALVKFDISTSRAAGAQRRCGVSSMVAASSTATPMATATTTAPRRPLR